MVIADARGLQRVSYSLPPPSNDEALPCFQVPPFVDVESRLHRSGPLLIPTEIYGGKEAHSSSGAASKDSGSRHATHTLAVTSLALDLVTCVGDDGESSEDDSDETQSSEGARKPTWTRPVRPYPRGILYTAGRDGLTASWDLKLPVQCRESTRQAIGGASPNQEGDMTNLELSLAEDGHLPSSTQADQHWRSDSTSRMHRPAAPSLIPGLQKSPASGRPTSIKVSPHTFQAVQPFWHPKARRRKPAFRQCIQSHTDWVNEIVLCNDNQTLISASSDRTVKAWNPHHTASQFKPHSIGSHADYVKCLALAPAVSKVFSGGFDRCVKLWDLNAGRSGDGEPVFQLGPGGGQSESSVYALATDESARTVAVGSTEHIVSVWDVRAKRQIAKLIGHTNNVKSLLISNDGQQILSGSSDSTIRLWSVAEQRCLHTFEHHNDSVWSLYSDHPRLDIFYSGDRQGYVCKVDWERCAEVDEGECVVLCRDSVAGQDESTLENTQHNGSATRGKATSAAAWSQRHKQLTHSGIHKIVAIDNAYFCTASNSSSVRVWEDIPTRCEREALYTSVQANAARMLGNPSDSPGQLAPQKHATRPSPLRNDLTQSSASPRSGHAPLPGSSGVSFSEPEASVAACSPSPSRMAGLVGVRMTSSPLARFNLTQEEGSDEHAHSYHFNGIPFDSLVNLSPFNELYAVGRSSVSVRRSFVVPRTHGMGTESMNTFNHPVSSAAARMHLVNTDMSPLRSAYDAASLPAALQFDVVGTMQSPSSSLRFSHSFKHAHQATSPPNSDVAPSINSRTSLVLDAEEDRELGVGHQLQAAFEERELAQDATPLRGSPAEVLEGSHGLIRSCMLNDRRHVLTIDTAGNVALWDIIKCTCLGTFEAHQVRTAALADSPLPENDIERENWKAVSYPGEVLEAVRERIEGCGATPLWCTADTRAGSLTVHLQEPRCYDAEMYLDELSFLPPAAMKEDQRVNVGKLLLRNLLHGFFTAEVSVRSGKLAGSTALAAEAHEVFEVEGDALAIQTPSFAALRPRTPGMTISMVTSPSIPAIFPSSTPFSPGSSSGLNRMLNALKIPADGPSNYFDSHPSTIPLPSTEVNAVMTPNSKTTPTGFMSRFKRARPKSQKQSRNVYGDVAAVDTTVSSTANASAEHTRVRAAREILCRTMKPLPESDAPVYGLPHSTPVVFSESSADAGQYEVTYRGLVGSTAVDVPALELCAPRWLLAMLFQGELQQKDPIKSSFILQPYSGGASDGVAPAGVFHTMPALPSGNACLTATQMLRMKKVATYVAEKLDMQLPHAGDDSIVASRRPSAVSSSGDATPSVLGAAAGGLWAHETIEILCNHVVLPPNLTLAQCRRFLWKNSADMRLEYRLRQCSD
ncbi:WD40 repeat-like protein [Tilletiaria anomala UBC 951]|uniref:WD40 repeat-like protein n=1 Tax=Tilletiaria anomala (strain ATCC 24038 / CBS 436.72 / UBC 951) TaxID=1037660 RepID=A0A066VF46_TILAU|nr:WD40 repeat-like protein [Tilletiaria anomala UBC 951]KDN40106.1 WD40 repeat-like protein [Tilletiaria anomala UBC 951]